MNYCIECGNKLITKHLEDEGMIPYCSICKEHRFEMFNSAISTVIFNQTMDKTLLIQQYGKTFNILVAGYINKGENANEALVREVKEEVDLNVITYQYNDNVYFDRSNTLIHNFIAIVDHETFQIKENEVDHAQWYTLEEAKNSIKPNSLAEAFLLKALKKRIGTI